MKLEYRIVWFENDVGFFSSLATEVKNIIRILNDNGFDVCIDIYHSGIPNAFDNRILGAIPEINLEKVENYLPLMLNSKKQNIKNSDLILVDYNLGGNNQDGDSIIKYIRDTPNDIYTDVIFYSTAIFDEQELRDRVKRDGLYCSKREDILGGKIKLEKVIDVTIRKTQDLNNLRGLIMAESSEIDKIMKEILKKIQANYGLSTSHGPSNCTSGLPCNPCIECTRNDKTFSDNQGNEIFRLRKKESINKTIEGAKSVGLFEAVKSFLGSSLNKTGKSISDIENYREETKRNILAHYPEDTSNPLKVKIIDDDGTEHNFDFEDLKKIRRKIRDYKKTFLEIRNLV